MVFQCFCLINDIQINIFYDIFKTLFFYKISYTISNTIKYSSI